MLWPYQQCFTHPTPKSQGLHVEALLSLVCRVSLVPLSHQSLTQRPPCPSGGVLSLAPGKVKFPTSSEGPIFSSTDMLILGDSYPHAMVFVVSSRCKLGQGSALQHFSGMARRTDSNWLHGSLCTIGRKEDKLSKGDS